MPIYQCMEQPPTRFPQPPRSASKRSKRGAFPQPAFKEAGSDLKSIFSHMNRRRWLFLALSFAVTFALLFGFLIDSDFRKLRAGPQLIYVESWSKNRSDAEIKAQQMRDQAVRKKIEEQRRQEFQRLEKKLGMD